jgi:hypothetical protein
VRRPPTVDRPSVLREASTRALSRVFELTFLVVALAVVVYAAFTWAGGPEVRDVLLWLVSLVRQGLVLAATVLQWAVDQLRRLG